MLRTAPRSLAAAALLGLCAPLGHADVIHKLDGKSLQDVEITNETLTQVTYKDKGKGAELSVPADQVLRVEYTSRIPRLMQEAFTAAEDGSIDEAAETLELFADGELSKGPRQAWAPGYALHKALEMRLGIGDLKGAVGIADKLIKGVPESRYVPYAYVAKAEAHRHLGEGPNAVATIRSLRDFATSKGLSQRWKLEADLEEIFSDAALKGDAKRDKLLEVIASAGNEFPTVANRARVAEGETYLEGERKDFAKAKAAFKRILGDPKADAATLAGAYTGMGDVLFQEAGDKIQAKDDAAAAEILREALEHYMRVVVVYDSQARYVPKALFYAGRTADLMQDEGSRARARRLYGAVIQDYPASPWAELAKKSRQ